MSLNYLEIAKAFAKEQGCDIVLPAGYEDRWYYFAFTKPNLPRYSSLKRAMRINKKGEVEELDGSYIRMKVSNEAYRLASKNK